eukprot:ctg_652.g427
MEDTGRPDEWDVAGGQAWLAALVQDHRRWRPCDGDERRLQAALLQLRQALRERYGGGGTTLWWLSDGGVRAPDDAAAVIDFEQLPVSQYGYWEAFLARVHQALERQCAAMRTTTTTTSGTGGADTVDKRTTPPYSGETMCLLLEVSARVLTNLFPESRHRYPSTNLLAELLVAAAPVDLAVVRSALEVLWSLVSAPLFHKPSCGPADPTWGGAYLRPLLSALVAHHPLYDELLRHERPEHVAHPIEAGRTAGGSASLALDASSAASADDGDRAAPRVPLLLYPETGTASDSFDSGCRSSPLSEASASTAAAPPPPPRECAACGTEPTGASLLEAISRTPDARETPRSPQATAVDPDDPPETVADQMARFRQAWQERLRRMRIHNACPHLQAARCLALSIRYQALAVLLALGTAPNQRDAPPADDPHMVAHLLEVVRGDRRLSGRLDARVEPLLRRSGLRLMAAGVSALRLERPILSSLGGDLGCPRSVPGHAVRLVATRAALQQHGAALAAHVGAHPGPYGGVGRYGWRAQRRIPAAADVFYHRAAIGGGGGVAHGGGGSAGRTTGADRAATGDGAQYACGGASTWRGHDDDDDDDDEDGKRTRGGRRGHAGDAHHHGDVGGQRCVVDERGAALSDQRARDGGRGAPAGGYPARHRSGSQRAAQRLVAPGDASVRPERWRGARGAAHAAVAPAAFWGGRLVAGGAHDGHADE